MADVLMKYQGENMKHSEKRSLKKFAAVMIALAAAVAAVFAAVFTRPTTSEAEVNWTKTVDPDTSDSYPEPQDTENIGKVWTDKTVTTTAEDSSLFNVQLSALSSALTKKTVISEGADIVLVLDVSGSMRETYPDSNFTPVYDIEKDGTYYWKYNGKYYLVDPYGKYDSWGLEFNNLLIQPVKPKTSPEDTDGFQFYTTDKNRMTVLKDSVNTFISRFEELNKDLPDDKKNRIALVKFAGEQYPDDENLKNNNIEKYNDEMYIYKGTQFSNYSKIVSGFTENFQTLTDEVNSLKPNGMTRADIGLELADELLKNDTRKNKIVLFFTDGVPTDSDPVNQKYLINFTPYIADAAVTNAHNIKQSGTSVYAIGAVPDANPDEDIDNTTNINTFLQSVSSNYADAQALESGNYINNNYQTNHGEKDPDGNYYYAAQDAEELAGAFENIYSDATIGAEYPVKVESGEKPDTGGYTTFTDQLGSYMEVKSFTSLNFNNVTYNKPEKTTNGNTDTYVFTGTGKTNLTADADLSKIIVQVLRSDDESVGDKVTVKVPAALMPANLYSLDTTGSDQTNSQAKLTKADNPIRISYQVGLKENTSEKLQQGNPEDAVSSTYFNANSKNGNLNFYTNGYSGEEHGTTTVSFTPSDSNEYYQKSPTETVKKDSNNTETADTVSHTDYNKDDTAVTEYLGNNGRLSVPLPGQLSITKNIIVPAGCADQSSTDFTFNVNVEGAAGEYPCTVKDSSGQTVSGSADTVTFDNDNNAAVRIKGGQTITIQNLPSGKKYTVTEPEQPDGFTLSDWSSDTGTVANGSVQNAEFTDTYSAGPLTYQLPVSLKKVLDGRSLIQGDKFYFVISPAYTGSALLNTSDIPLPQGLTEVEGNKVYTLTAEKSGGNELTGNLGSLNFDVPGTYTYTLTEYCPAGEEISGITYSQAEYILTLNVVDDGKGKLTLDENSSSLIENFNDNHSKTVKNISKDNGTYECTFTNKFTTDNVSVNLQAKKNYTDESGDHPLKVNMFQFTLQPSGDNAAEAPMPEGTGTDDNGNRIYTAHNDSVGEIPLGKLELTQKMIGNTYTYKLREVNDGKSHVKYDATEHTIQITVGQNQDNGAIAYTVTYDNKNSNGIVFNNTYKADSAELSLQGTKTILGRDMYEDESFEFELSAAEDSMDELKNQWFTMPAKTAVNVTGGKKGEPVTFTFDSIQFNHTGTYYFYIKEIAGFSGGMMYDNHTDKVTVVVTDNDGKLTAAADYGTYSNKQGNSFVNIYQAETAYTGVNISKTLNGRDMNANEFSFVAVDQNGESTETDFTNPEAEKDGQKEVWTIFEGKTFTQEDIGKTFKYKIEEKKDNLHGVTYDSNFYTVEIQVLDNKDGTLHTITEVKDSSGKVVSTADSNDNAMAEVPFTNTYNAKGKLDGTKITVTKQLTGRDWLDSDSFTFTLDQKDGPEQALTAQRTITINKNTENHSANFGDIEFTKPGDYKFVVAEVLPKDSEGNETYSADGIAYDTDQHRTVNVRVTDNGDGTLSAEVFDSESTVFTNTYEPESVTDSLIPISKTLENRNFAAGDTFSFRVQGSYSAKTDYASGEVPASENADCVPMPEGADEIKTENNMKTGIYTWNYSAGYEGNTFTLLNDASINFTKAGTYTYQIKEIPDSLPGITYSAAIYKLQYVVTDDQKGHLTCSKTIVKEKNDDNSDAGNASVQSAAFVNTSAEDIEVTLYGKKVYEDKSGSKPIQDGMFSFTLQPSGDNAAEAPMPEGTAANQYVSWNKGELFSLGTIKLTQKDVGKIYNYTVTENIDENLQNAGMTYDTQIHTISLDVKQDSANKIYVEVKHDGESSRITTFSNTYQPKAAAAEISGTKLLTGRDLKDGEYIRFNLEPYNEAAINGVADKTVTMDNRIVTVKGLKDGVEKGFTFGKIHFSKTGTYQFAMSEGTVNAPGVSKDTAVKTVTVAVTDDGTGQLKAAVTYSPDNAFKDTYSIKPVSMTLQFTKVLVGRNTGLRDGEFSFTLQVDGNKDGWQAEKTSVTNSANGSVDFGSIKFTKAGTYKLTVKETVPDPAQPFMEYDSHHVTINVTVKENDDGTLSIAKKEQTGKSEFINTLDIPKDTKKVSDVDQNGNVTLSDSDGDMVSVGDSLKYTIHWVNNALDENGQAAQASIKVKDVLPAGLAFVSADNGGTFDENTNTITWNLGTKNAGDQGDVSFIAKVDMSSLPLNSDNMNVISNTGTVLVNDYSYETNPVKNSVPEKIVLNAALEDIDGQEVKVGDILTYRVYYANAESDPEDICITDSLDQGLEFIDVENGGVYDSEKRKVEWNILSAEAGAKGYVSFRARVTEKALENRTVDNQASITVNNQTDQTNTTHNTVKTGNISLSKITQLALKDSTVLDPDKEFEFSVSFKASDGSSLENEYQYAGYIDGTTAVSGKVKSGGTITLKNNGYITIKDLPSGSSWTITEIAPNGYIPVQWMYTGTIPSDDYAQAAYVNNYSLQSISVPLKVTKVLQGRDSGLQAGEFKFKSEISGPEDGWSIDSSEAVNNADGSVDFGKIKFTKVGTYTVRVREDTADPEPFITYDQHVYSFNVIVTDGGDGLLYAQKKDISGSDTFTNTYDEPENTKDVTKIINNVETSVNGQMVGVGDELTYKIHWVNNARDTETGKACAADVTVTDTVPTGTSYVDGSASAHGEFNNGKLTWELGTVAAGAQGDVTFKVKVNDSAVSVDAINNTAQVKIGDHDPVSTNEVTNTVPKKTVDVLKAYGEDDSGQLIGVGDELKYTITWKNTTGKTADIVIHDTVPAGTEYVSGSADQDGTEVTAPGSDGVITWIIRNTEDQDEGSVHFTVKAAETLRELAGKTVDNTAAVKIGNDPEIETNTTHNPVPYKTVTDTSGKDIDGKAVSVGDELTYTIHYQNTESSPAAVTITDTIPEGTEYIDGSADNSGTYSNGTISWKLSNVPAGAEGTVSFKVKVTDDAAKNADYTVRNKATVNFNDHPAVTNEVTNIINVKEVTENVNGTITSVDGKTVNVGDELTYTIHYQNTESSPADVTITDTIPKGTEYIDGSADNSGNYSDGKITWKLSNVPAGAEGTVSFKVKVSEDAYRTLAESHYQIKNTGKVQVNNNPAVETNTVTDTVPIKRVVRTDEDNTAENIDGKQVGVGEVLTYRIPYFNIENSPIDVAAYDTVPDGTTYVDGSAKVFTYNDNKEAAENTKAVVSVSHKDITWKLADISVGEAGYAEFKVTVNKSAVNLSNKKVENTALVKVNDDPSMKTNTTENPVTRKDVLVNNVSVDNQAVSAGQTLHYTIDWQNRSDQGSDIKIVDKIPEGTKYEGTNSDAKWSNTIHAGKADSTELKTEGNKLTWTIKNVSANASGTLGFDVKVTSVGKEIQNTASVNDVKTNTTENWTEKKDVEITDGEKTITDADGYPVGPEDILTYRIHWDNHTGEAADIVISDSIPKGTDPVNDSVRVLDKDGNDFVGTYTSSLSADGLKCRLSGVENDAGGTVQFQVRVKKSSELSGITRIDNTAKVQIGENHPKVETNTTHNPIPKKTVSATTADNTMIYNAGGMAVSPGDILTYTIHYENTKDTAAKVTVTDTVPTGTKYIADSAEGIGADVTKSGDQIVWTIDGVKPYTEGKVSFKVKVTDDAAEKLGADADIQNTGTVSLNDGPSVHTTTTHNPVEKKTVSVTGSEITVYDADGREAGVGDYLTYSVNWKTGRDANVTVTDNVPAGTEFVNASGSPEKISSNGKVTRVIWNLGSHKAGDSGTVSFTVKVTEEAGALADHTVKNTAYVKIGNDPTVTTNEVTNPVPYKEVHRNSNTANADGDLVGVGDELQYVIHYKNTETSPADVTITDTIPKGTEYIDGSADNSGTCSDGTIAWTLSNVPAGEEGTVSFRVKVTEDAVNNKEQQIDNQAAVSIGNHPSVQTNTVTNPVPYKTVESITKQNIDGAAVGVGTQLNYVIHYRNTESSPADVTITDTIPKGTEYIDGSADNSGNYSNGKITWEMSKVPAGAEGTVSFSVTVADDALNTDIENNAEVKIGDHPAVTNKVKNFVPEKKVLDSDGNDINGKIVQSGETLTYTISWKNDKSHAEDITIYDTIPTGTAYVENTAVTKQRDGTVRNENTSVSMNNNQLVWKITQAKAGESGTAEFQVKVNANATATKIDNKAVIRINGDPAAETNHTVNSTVRKNVFDADGNSIDGEKVKAGDVLTYRIDFVNPSSETKDVTVTDKVPEGTEFVDADKGGTCIDGTITWKVSVYSGEQASVSFKVKVTQAAFDLDKMTVSNTALVDDIPTNEVTNTVEPNTLTVTKKVIDKAEESNPDENQTFTFTLRLADENGKPLTESYKTDKDNLMVTDGSAFTLKAGETIKIIGLPQGTEWTITETSTDDYTWEGDNGQNVYTQSGSIGYIDSETAVTFANIYQPETEKTEEESTGSVKLPVKKTVEGSGAKPQTYTFVLTPDKNNPDGKTEPQYLEINTADEAEKYFTLTFTETGTYTYTVKELSNKELKSQGYQFDASEYTVTYEVTEDGTSEPSASASATGTPEPSATASATGTPEPSATASATGTPEPSASASATGTPEPSATASVTGTPEPSASSDKTSEAEASEETQTADSMNDTGIQTESESLSSPAPTVSSVPEIAQDTQNILPSDFDQSKLKMPVFRLRPLPVEEPANSSPTPEATPTPETTPGTGSESGEEPQNSPDTSEQSEKKYSVTRTIEMGGKTYTEIMFVNKFNPKGTPESTGLTLEAVKTLDGEQPGDKTFAFALKDEAGKVIQRAENTSDGKIAFTELTYSAEDAGKTFRYTISEEKGSDETIDYDERVYTVTVTPSLKDKELVLDVKYTCDGKEVSAVEFDNKTKETDEPEPDPTPTPQTEETPEPDNPVPEETEEETKEKIPFTPGWYEVNDELVYISTYEEYEEYIAAGLSPRTGVSETGIPVWTGVLGVSLALALYLKHRKYSA